tara:strand:- start:3148 stop:4323 length:1176 start_codon:yes stop_codon:yes gene_type:complete
MYVKFYDAIKKIGKPTWQRICGTDYPFLRYEFLASLEDAGSDNEHGSACNQQSGWQPQHGIVFDGEKPIAAIPLYLKYHSYGEYIFDWAWAEAYQRNGLNYYPKLLNAIPYSPVTGTRIAIDSDHSKQCQTIYSTIVSACKIKCQEEKISSCHFLYPQQDLSIALSELQIEQRSSHQYHWFNHSRRGELYLDFNDFLADLKSRKRKDIKKERALIAREDIQLERLTGEQIDAAVWDHFYHFYQLTYAKRSGHGGYLPKEFFRSIGETMPEQLLLVLAKRNGKLIAGALNFFSSDTLYGRYWGCTEAAESLHFEACYYQGIEFCIERKLKKFDAGAQGEHKIQRGFRPVPTWSNHWIQDPQFDQAIKRYIHQEAKQVKANIEQASDFLPFKA